MSKKPRPETKTAKPEKASPESQAASVREAIESIVIAIILAFLFRAFEAEAFVIPTGSMATTLQGRHKDVTCPECTHQFQTGANLETERIHPISYVTCPLCFHVTPIELSKASHRSNTGDRILVNKFAYERPFGNPKRWDVAVFKFPGNAKQNYIKRLVGLENESVLIRHGDLFLSRDPNAKDADFRIARKPPHKLLAILDPVFDSERLAKSIVESDWQLNWQGGDAWSTSDRGETYTGKSDGEVAWLNYRQLYMDYSFWDELKKNPKVEDKRFPVLVTDFYAYNQQNDSSLGRHWVGDLAVEAEVEVESAQGELILNLVESGRQHLCTIDLSTGQATLSIDNSQGLVFADGESIEKETVVGKTSVKGRGRYRLRFANCDDQLTLWVGNRVIEFDGPTTYGTGGIRSDRPRQADLEPVRIGIKNAQVKLNRLAVLRDIYYIAVNSSMRNMSEYQLSDEGAFRDPEQYASLFDSRRQERFDMREDQFFMLGDNSPSSKDSRLWSEIGADGAVLGHWVDRDMLIGKAVLIYWPHGIRVGVPGTNVSLPPIIPNLPRMGLIR